MKTSRVLICDDHPLIRLGLAEELNKEEDFIVVGQVGNATDLFHYVHSQELPDLLILDVSLPDMDGMDVIVHLKQFTHAMPVVIFSMHEIMRYLRYFEEHGAAAYLSKNTPMTEVAPILRRVLAGERYFPELLQASGNMQQAELQITRTEKRFLQSLQHTDQLVVIAQELSFSVEYVERVYQHLLHKLDITNREELLQTARKHQWI